MVHMADFKQSTVRLTKLELEKQEVLIPQTDRNAAGAEAADATIVFHTVGGDQALKVKILSWMQMKKKARISIAPAQ